jgi:hypothetical protein
VLAEIWMPADAQRSHGENIPPLAAEVQRPVARRLR